MNYAGVFLCILIAATTSKADVVKARGAEKRRHLVEYSQTDIEDVMRAEEDPDFSKFLKEREREKKAEKAAALNYEKQHHADEEAYEKARIQFINEEDKSTASDETKKYRQYLKEKKAWRQQQEKYRREYVNAQQKQEDKLRFERMARMQKLISPQRMPASR